MDNAVSYSDEGGAIAIGASLGKGRLMIRIENSGSAISQEQVPLLFQRFWRGDQARSDAGRHCGIGLSLCQSLTSLLGGSIRIESQQGGKFVAIIELPE